MSHTTITQSTRDQELLDRIAAAIGKEAWNSPVYSVTPTGQRVQEAGTPNAVLGLFTWPISIDNEAAYAYAVANENPSPGGDPTVITDAALTAGVQAHWPDLVPQTQPIVPTEPPPGVQPSHNVQS